MERKIFISEGTRVRLVGNGRTKDRTFVMNNNGFLHFDTINYKEVYLNDRLVEANHVKG